ncbi:hypothetical protein VNO77_26951 [Canavalia gladiata]|uniref:Uncharacterized protein n=1 Tax=Canavalia gladiata TaxID=3824 RepID=A0AAN9Q619_CANGL
MGVYVSTSAILFSLELICFLRLGILFLCRVVLFSSFDCIRWSPLPFISQVFREHMMGCPDPLDWLLQLGTFCATPYDVLTSQTALVTHSQYHYN